MFSLLEALIAMALTMLLIGAAVPLVATNHVHYHDPARRALQDVLTCVWHGCTIREAGFKLFPNGERYLKSPAQMHRLFADLPGAIRRGLDIAERCSFSLGERRPDQGALLRFARRDTTRGHRVSALGSRNEPHAVPPDGVLCHSAKA